jgi:GNAT superfamily N-acetyltransferase
METAVEIKVKDIDLTDVRVKMELHEGYGTDMFDENNENDYIDLIVGEILYFDHDEKNDKVIGKFKLKMLYGSEQKIFTTLDNQSITDLKYAEELFDVTYSINGYSLEVREEYEDLMSEIYENSFLILDRIEIDENYRGNGILGKVMDTIYRVYKQPILTLPFPLQHEGNCNSDTFKADRIKVVNAYKKCGFKRKRKRSAYFVKC